MATLLFTYMKESIFGILSPPPPACPLPIIHDIGEAWKKVSEIPTVLVS